MKHLEQSLFSGKEPDIIPKVESIRFRSTAYSVDSGPKKAGFATKDLMEETTKSTNAYVVYSTEAMASMAATKLNGTVILGRHLRIDGLASPSKIDHKRCIFVGNLNFVDQETHTSQTDDNGSQPRRPKGREPADAEEGLWRTFSRVGKVENVRVVRDKSTRVGKGFAYVQFADANSVEAALLLNEKKFPPMLPRKLRVMRAKKVREKLPKASQNGSASLWKTPSNGVKKGGSLRPGSRLNGDRRGGLDSKVVFEGNRARKASEKDEKHKKRRSIATVSRSAKRGAAFKAGKGKKIHESK
jgi:nucleolar protein 12